MSGFDLASHQRGRIRELERRVHMLEAEERRLYRLLALALRVATRDGRDCKPGALLEVLCAIDGTDPARPAWVEEAQRAAADAENERVLQVLRETDPASSASASASSFPAVGKTSASAAAA